MSVYFITARDVGMVKIGCANDPWDRVHKLSTASPVALALEAVVDGSYREERTYHNRFAVNRVRGEWFKLSPEIEAIIRGAPEPVRGFGGNTLSQKKKLAHLREDNRAIETRRLRQMDREAEERIEAQIQRERELYVEALKCFASLDGEAA